jgi:hypothetical protein
MELLSLLLCDSELDELDLLDCDDVDTDPEELLLLELELLLLELEEQLELLDELEELLE